jgi:hypothetical protein
VRLVYSSDLIESARNSLSVAINLCKAVFRHSTASETGTSPGTIGSSANRMSSQTSDKWAFAYQRRSTFVLLSCSRG